MKELTIRDVETIVEKSESRVLEVKKTTGELQSGMCSGCAFLNTEGGWLLFGITPTLKITGQDVSDATRREIARELRKLSPTIDLAVQYVDLEDGSSKKVIAIWFPDKGRYEAPYTYDGRAYYKVENTTALMPREMFVYRVRFTAPESESWERMSNPSFKVRDISNKTLMGAINGGINKGRIPEDASKLKTILERLDFFKLRDASGNISNGAIVLFGKEPNRHFLQCRVKLARFEGTDMDRFRDEKTCYGNLFEQFNEVLTFCRKHMFMSGTMDEPGSVITLSVPLKALREIVLNMLVHQFWWSQGQVCTVAIFDDRVEFMNPGTFPGGATAADYLKRPQSKPLNKTIAEVFYKSGEMEAWGRGILTAVKECRNAGLRKPTFEIYPDSVCVTVWFKDPLVPRLTKTNEPVKWPVKWPVNGTLKQVYDVIQTTPGIKKQAIMQMTGKGRTIITRYLYSLSSEGLIEYKGSDKTGGYYIKHSEK